VQGRFNNGAGGGELAELRTTAAAPERTVGPDVFALLPLPAILMAVGLSPLKMLLVVATWARA